EPPPIPPIPEPSAAAIELPPGYQAEVVISHLTYPSTVALDDAGNLYVAESGYVYGDPSAPARIWRVGGDGGLQLLVGEGLNGPITDLLWHRGQLFVSHRGKVSIAGPDGLRDIVTGLPSHGDHFNNQLAVGPDGKIYMGQGTATNSGVVGVDNWAMGWLKRYPRFHDTPAQTIQLRNVDILSLNPMVLTVGKKPPMATTGAFQAFGENDKETVQGAVKANGAVLRFDPDGSGLEVYAWGLRNPYGLAWTGDGRLISAENGFDDRGSRPVDNAPDTLWEIRQGAWYGWPDYASGMPVTDARFQPSDKPDNGMLMAEHPPLQQPFLRRPPHSAVTQLALSTSPDFGHAGHLFLGEFGDMAPLTGQVDRPTGFGVFRIDPATKQVQPFARTKSDALGPKGLEYIATAGLKRPVDVAFSASGNTLYIADIGVFAVPPTVAPLPMPMEATGVIWRIYRTGATPEGPPAGVSMLPGTKRQAGN
ncbi:MAG: PQQ-dependent sugar dehydrogenase, partial [Proteobacteria bacterium]|nr:PQQ-dependent sugar dehydrogenase [Pseudomonadota bacterium]